MMTIDLLSCGFTSHSTQNSFPLPQASLLAWYGKKQKKNKKTKPNTTKGRIHQSKQMNSNTNKHKKTKARF